MEVQFLVEWGTTNVSSIFMWTSQAKEKKKDISLFCCGDWTPSWRV